MTKRIYSWIIFIASMLVIWEMFALYIHNSFIMPFPYDVIKTMFLLLINASFYKAVGITFFRILVSIVLSFFFAFLLAYICLNVCFIRSWVDKLMTIIRTIPNVVLIVLFLFWFNREIVTFLVSFLLLCPIIYESILRGLLDIENEWKDVLYMFPQPFWTKFRLVHLPLLKTSVISSLIVSCSMGVKVGIMAEILGQVPIGIGRQIQLAKLDIDLTLVMAWTIWILIIVFVINFFLKKLESSLE